MAHRTIVVAGIASKAANLAPMVQLGELFGGKNVQFVEGAHAENGVLVASTHSYQAAELRKLLADAEDQDEIVIIAHSLGALALLSVLEDMPPDARVRALAIAPPLPSPDHVIQHPRMQRRIEVGASGEQSIPSTSFALGDNGPSNTPPAPVRVVIPDSYFEEVATQSVDFADRLAHAADAGRIQLVIPTGDWNRECIEMAGSYAGTVYIEGATHSLHDPDSARLQATCQAIYDSVQSSNAPASQATPAV